MQEMPVCTVRLKKVFLSTKRLFFLVHNKTIRKEKKRKRKKENTNPSSKSRPLATSQYLISHEPLRATSADDKSSNTSTACGHYFLDALSWMRPELEQGKLDGRLECPKCHANVGKYAWQGMQCSCGDWVLPAISLIKSRVDTARTRPAGSVAGGMGIRMPPGGGRPAGGQNL
jgi:dual specificity phosphatase 12